MDGIDSGGREGLRRHKEGGKESVDWERGVKGKETRERKIAIAEKEVNVWL